MKAESGFTFIMFAALLQMAVVTSLWAGAAYAVYKILQHFGIL